MATFSVKIFGDELNELNTIVQDIQAESDPEMTGSKYLTNIAMQFLTPRVREILIHEARTADLAELKQKLGDPVELRIKQRKRGAG